MQRSLGRLVVMALIAGSFEPAHAGELFAEVAAATGLDFVYDNGMIGELYFVEMVGPGGALFDYDADGDLDVFFVQGHRLGPGAPAKAERGGRLFKNELVESGQLRFRDVTAASGITTTGYGLGAAVGDVNNDGAPDLYVLNWGANQMWTNNGDGTFRDTSKSSGTDDPGWGQSATFFDFDRDGWLDLYVANYVDFTYAYHKACYAPSSARDYCGPLSFRPQADRLFRNRRDGTFAPVGLPVDPATAGGNGLGVVAGDFNRDGWLDLYVANDQQANYLWINERNGTFTDQALLTGAALSLEGKPQASMGVVAEDFDDDGDEDLVLTHLNGETNTYYRNDGQGNFDDATGQSRLGGPSWPMTSFGVVAQDFDGDLRLDLYVANGEVKRIQAQAGEPLPLRQRNQLFRNLGGGRFDDATAAAGRALELVEVSRGAAGGDVDNDGDPDVLVFNNQAPARLLLNQQGAQRWIGLRVVEGKSRRDALGAEVRLRLSDGRTIHRRVKTDGSYSSASDPRLLVSLPGVLNLEWVEVGWVDGDRERFDRLDTGGYRLLERGKGKPVGRAGS